MLNRDPCDAAHRPSSWAAGACAAWASSRCSWWGLRSRACPAPTAARCGRRPARCASLQRTWASAWVRPFIKHLGSSERN